MFHPFITAELVRAHRTDLESDADRRRMAQTTLHDHPTPSVRSGQPRAACIVRPAHASLAWRIAGAALHGR